MVGASAPPASLPFLNPPATGLLTSSVELSYNRANVMLSILYDLACCVGTSLVWRYVSLPLLLKTASLTKVAAVKRSRG
jgi:hypothetical protein